MSKEAPNDAWPDGQHGFMAPEVCTRGKVGPPADVFSFAMMCHGVVAGQFPSSPQPTSVSSVYDG